MTERSVELTFMGRRITTKGKLSFCWCIIAENRTVLYAKNFVPALIGEIWLCTLTEEDSVMKALDKKPIRVDRFSPKDSIDLWNASDVASLAELAQEKMLRTLAKRKSEFERAIIPIKAMSDSIRYHDERAAFIQYVITELWRR